uniref:Uncharacterized protein n=1 Tax=Anopheles epiroticus TaxID=199890 RepID=A0A182PWK3_9DIPT
MASLMYPAKGPVALDNVENLLLKIATEMSTLQGEEHSMSNMFKDTKFCNFHQICSATYDIPSNIATEFRIANETAESMKFLSYSKTINNVSSRLTMLIQEAKRMRRNLDQSVELDSTFAEQLSLQKLCLYLDQALSLMYAKHLALHEIKLTTNALYVHGHKTIVTQQRETNDLKDKISRFTAIMVSKHTSEL